MKLFFLVAFYLIANHLKSQTADFGNLWGKYEYDNNLQISLKICEENKWTLTNCPVKWVLDTHGEQIPDCVNSLLEFSGNYNIMDSVIYLYSKNDSLFSILKIIDTLNLQVLHSKEIFGEGVYLNREMAFFPNHYCDFGLPDYNNLRWIIFNAGEIWLFKRPENYLISKDYEIIKLPEGLWKKNE